MEKGFKFKRMERYDTERQYIDKVIKQYWGLVRSNGYDGREVRQMVVKEKTKDIITAYQNYDLLDYLATQMVKKLGRGNIEAQNDFLYDLIEAAFELKRNYPPLIDEILRKAKNTEKELSYEEILKEATDKLARTITKPGIIRKTLNYLRKILLKWKKK